MNPVERSGSCIVVDSKHKHTGIDDSMQQDRNQQGSGEQIDSAEAYNSMWFIYLVAFFYAWGGIMVKPAKAVPFRCKLPEKPYPVVWVIAVALTLVDIFVFGPGIYF